MSQPRIKTNTLIKNALMATPLLTALPASSSLADIITTGEAGTYQPAGNPMPNLDIEGDFTIRGRPHFGGTTDGTLLVNNASRHPGRQQSRRRGWPG